MRTIPVLCLALLTGVVGWSADYLRDGPDAGGTGWVKGEKIFTPANAKDMKLLWKIKLDAVPRVTYNLLTPLVAEHVKTASGEKQIVLVTGVSDVLFGIDADTGTLLWTKHLDLVVDSGRGGGLCPGGQDATPLIAPTSTPGKYTVYAIAGDGRLWQVNLADGENVAPPAKFMPPNGKAWALNLFQGVIYSSTSQGCGTVPYSFFSYDLATGKSSAFLPAGGGLWGRRGPVIGDDGTVYMGTGDGPFDPESGQLGNAVVAVKLNADKELKLAGYYAPKNANYNWMRDLDFNVSPMAFDYKGRHWLLTTGKECRMQLSDRDKFGGADHTSEVIRTPLVCNDEQYQTTKGVWGSLGAWVDPHGAQWIYMPFWGPVSRTFHAPIEYGRPREGAVAAFKLKDTNGKVTLEPAWLSTNMINAEEVVIANGVVFTYGTGDHNLRDDHAWNDPPPPDRSTVHLTMYALDALTGKELWNSGNDIAASNHFTGMSAANGHAYVGTVDGYLYCFGVTK